MSESTCEATSLLEADLAQFNPSPVARSEATTSAMVVGSEQSSRAIQAALATELLSLDEVHDALIRHYMPLNNVRASLA